MRQRIHPFALKVQRAATLLSFALSCPCFFMLFMSLFTSLTLQLCCLHLCKKKRKKYVIQNCLCISFEKVYELDQLE